MTTLIALLRGINVGGNNMLPMKDLKVLIEKCGCSDVQTYIQSGNVVLRSAAADRLKLAAQLAEGVRKTFGFEPHVLLLSLSELEKAAAANPFPEAAESPKTVHLFFLDASPKKADLASCEAIKGQSERFALAGRVFYMHTPDGLGKSKLAARAERLLGVKATARNWNTVTTLIDLARAAG